MCPERPRVAHSRRPRARKNEALRNVRFQSLKKSIKPNRSLKTPIEVFRTLKITHREPTIDKNIDQSDTQSIDATEKYTRGLLETRESLTRLRRATTDDATRAGSIGRKETFLENAVTNASDTSTAKDETDSILL